MNLHENTNNELNGQVEESLCKKFGKTVKIISSKSIGGGCINSASKIETNIGPFFLKWNSNCEKDIFLKEAESLNELRKAAGDYLVVPQVFATKEVGSSPGFLVQEYLEPRFSMANDDEILGRGLAFIHKYSNKKFGFYSNNYCGATIQKNDWTKSWIEFFSKNRLAFLLNLIQKERPLPSPEKVLYEKLLDRIPSLLPAKSEPVLIHGDLWSGNFITSEKGPVLIDPASYYADREMEFAIITMFGGFSERFYSAYNEVNPLSSDWKKRNKLYQLYHILNHYYLFGGGYRLQALSVAKQYL